VQEAQTVAQATQTSLEDCVRLAMAEQMATARTTQSCQTWAAHADPQAFLAVLQRIKLPRGVPFGAVGLSAVTLTERQYGVATRAFPACTQQA
jgi:hypothetical protein